MQKNLLFSIIFFIVSAPIFSQEIKGVILDSDGQSVEFATVSAINPKDSILISYSNTNSKGEFELTELKSGKFIFQVNYIGLKTYSKIVEFKDKTINLGEITLEIANELDEVVVSANIPIVLKKDTIAYSSKAFKVRVDDNVEDLLKKLPGIEIDANGKITAQGESVTKIYVDGKEFFSGDPAIATKNLSAYAIKSIEVIDEKSDKARVSGVNDTDTKKIINLKLKDDKKINDFGNVQGGYGTDDRFATRINYNRFTPTVQMSVFGRYNNINSSGSDITEIVNSSGSRSGIITTGIGGVNLSYEIKKKQSLGADYFYNNISSNSGDVFTTRTEFIDDLEIKSESRSRSENINISNDVNFNFLDRSDKLSSLTLYGNYRKSSNNSNSTSTLDKYNGDGDLDLESIGKNFSESESNSTSLTARYTKRFKEESKRSIYLKANIDYSDKESTSNNNQFNKFNISDPDNTFNSKQVIIREGNDDNISFSLKSEYTESIAENHYLEVEGIFKFKSKKEYVNQSNVENDMAQASLIYNQFYENADIGGSFRYKYSKDKFTLSAGADVVNQNQFFGIKNDMKFDNNYTNVNPVFKMRYRPRKGVFMFFKLSKSVSLPSISMLTPVVNDYNPLYIRKGNPNVEPSKRYRAYASYGKFFYDIKVTVFIQT